MLNKITQGSCYEQLANIVDNSQLFTPSEIHSQTPLF